MAKIKRSNCGEKNEGTVKKCSKCDRKIRKTFDISYWKFVGYCFIQLLFVLLLLIFSEKFYSGTINDLLGLFIVSIILIVNSLLLGIYFLKKGIKNILFYLVLLFFLFFGSGFFYRTIVAFKYENCSEVYLLASYYSKEEAKTIKENINNLFEYDYDNVFSRNVIIDSFYNDEDVSVLYLNDSYGNYKLKFYLSMNDKYDIVDVYYMIDEVKFYLVSDGKKTDNFEFYYAMYILNNVLGEEIDGIAKIEKVIEDKVRNKFAVSANIMFNYENLVYDEKQNSFSFAGNAYNMDYYSNMEDINYTVTFRRRDNALSKSIWYYGDSSFDYVICEFNI